MFYKVVFWIIVALMVMGLIGFLFMVFMACSMSDAPITHWTQCFTGGR